MQKKKLTALLVALTLLLASLTGCSSVSFTAFGRPAVDPATYFLKEYIDGAMFLDSAKERPTPFEEVMANGGEEIDPTGGATIVDQLPEPDPDPDPDPQPQAGTSSGAVVSLCQTPFFTWGRDQLNTDEKAMYDTLCDYIAAYRTDVMEIPGDFDMLCRVCDAIDMDRPDFYWYFYDFYVVDHDDGTISVWSHSDDAGADGYSMDLDTVLEMEAWINEEVDRILSGIDASWSDFSKALYVYDYLTRNVTYDMDTLDDQSIASCLVYHRAVCTGYAEAFQYLMLRLGIPSTKVVGYMSGSYDIGHAWVMAQLDGTWYYLDPTWDAWGNEEFTHIYFCLDEATLSLDHEVDNPLPLPVTGGLTHYYPNYLNYTMDHWDMDEYLQICREQYERGYTIFEVRFTTQALLNQAISAVYEANLYDMEIAIDPTGTFALSGDYYDAADYLTLCLFGM